MLHLEAVEPGTLSLLKELMSLPELNEFALVGGTALALRYGHRSSVDIDLFNTHKFDLVELPVYLAKHFGNRFEHKHQQSGIGIFCFIDDIKVDLIHFPIQPIADLMIEMEIRFYSDADIAAMKVQAILGRAKKKDFWDLQVLLKQHSLQQIIDWHQQKYPNQMLAISIPHAITYFTDADESETPVSFNGQTWSKVKKDISRAVREYLS
ncbi:MAG: nucleotidyl transferase AbiEii/AbiGii toxin family protein [Bacteroidales bacterium]|nr:nucleotidyl transferase AbiEii/AbiGii toxin family protein [Bacteroidales bacterium]